MQTYPPLPIIYKGFLLPLLFLVWGLYPCQAQDSLRWDFEELGVNQGLSAGMVYEVAEDPQGFLWIATEAGLNRFDGYEVREYTSIPGDWQSLPDDQIQAITMDGEDRMWLNVGQAGLVLFDRKEHAFHTLGIPVQRWMKMDQKGKLWIQHAGPAWKVIALAPGEKSISEIKKGLRVIPASDFYRGIPDTLDYLNFGFTSQGEMWGLHRDSLIIWKLNAQNNTGEVQNSIHLGEGKASNRAGRRVFENPEDGSLYIHWNDSIIKLSLDRKPEGVRIPLPAYLSGAESLMLDRDERMWFSNKGRIFRLNLRNKTVTELYHEDEMTLKSGAKVGISHRVLEDRMGNFWWPSAGFGLAKYRGDVERFGVFRDYQFTSISNLFLTQENKPAINQSGIIFFDPMAKKMDFRIKIDSDELAHLDSRIKLNPGITRGIQDRQGIFWISVNAGKQLESGENEGGKILLKLDAEGNLLGEPNLCNPDNNCFFPHALFLDQQDRLWSYMYKHKSEDQPAGVLLYKLLPDANPNYARFQFDAPDKKLQFDSGICFHATKDGRIWVGTAHGGMVIFDEKKNAWEHYILDPQNEKSISDNTVISFLPDADKPDSIMWVGTKRGLNRMDIHKKEFSCFTTQDGLPNDVICGMLADDHGNMWISTNRGLFLFDPRMQKVLRTFYLADGLQNNEFNAAAVRGRDSLMYFGGITGLTFFNPESFYQDSLPSPILITGLRLANEKVSYSRDPHAQTRGYTLPAPIESRPKIVLGYDQRMLSFEYAVMDLSHVEAHRYRYRLQGLDDEWIEAGNSNRATFTNLDPGKYTFQVQGANHHGIWNEEGASIGLVILTPWWMTWWFRTLMFLLGLAIIYGFFAFRTRQKQKVQDIRDAISRDLHDEIGSTLSSIGIFGAVAQKSLGQSQSTVSNLLSRINSNTTQMMEAMNDIVWAVKSENDRLEALVNRMRAFCSELGEASEVKVRFDVSEKLAAISLDMMQRRNLYMIFKEAVNNAFKYAHCQHLFIRIVRIGHEICMQIEDDGKGFNPEKEESNMNKMGGNGLKNMQRRADELKGKLEISTAPEKGTRIVLTFLP